MLSASLQCVAQESLPRPCDGSLRMDHAQRADTGPCMIPVPTGFGTIRASSHDTALAYSASASVAEFGSRAAFARLNAGTWHSHRWCMLLWQLAAETGNHGQLDVTHWAISEQPETYQTQAIPVSQQGPKGFLSLMVLPCHDGCAEADPSSRAHRQVGGNQDEASCNDAGPDAVRASRLPEVLVPGVLVCHQGYPLLCQAQAH